MPNEHRRIIGTESNYFLYGGDADYTTGTWFWKRTFHVFWEIVGSGRNDIITGGSNADRLFGNEGDDVIVIVQRKCNSY
jgi:Ca2+-binding RTX toxin-like protein